MNRNGLTAGLIVLNGVLVAAILLSSFGPPAAYAQRVGTAGNFIAVTCESDQDYDILYIADLGGRKLHVFAPTRTQPETLEYVMTRDLADEFGR